MRPVPAAIAARLPPAAELFAERGLDDTKIEDVATATGVPKATLYYYFTGKADILAYLLRDVLLRIGDEVEIAVQTDGTAAERLSLVIDAQIRVLAEQPAVCQALLGDLGRASRIPELLAALSAAFWEPVEALLRQGAQDGSLTAEPEPLTAAVAVFGAVTVVGLSALALGKDADQQGTTRAVKRVVMSGLLPR